MMVLRLPYVRANSRQNSIQASFYILIKAMTLHIEFGMEDGEMNR